MLGYTVLRRGDRLPTVGVLQKLLNSTGAALRPDCTFGAQTESALRAFQDARGIPEEGVVGARTWERLAGSRTLPIVDCVDVFDEGLYKHQAQVVLQTNTKPLFIGGMSNGLAQVEADLGHQRDLFLLRFIGHGCPGVQGLGIGLGGWIEPRPGGKPLIHFFKGERSRVKGSAARRAGWDGLTRIFGPYASVELHGCHVGAGKVGHQLLASLAKVLRVPVTASSASQHQAVGFDGPTITVWPPGMTASRWAASLPDFIGRSVP
ncbi:MAG: peptidoglycan-binding protein [Phenylobacterium sp.]